MKLVRKKIFNTGGDREKEKRRVIFGNPTNVLELNQIKYKWAYEFYKLMGFKNFWVPEEIPLLEDKKFYRTKLREEEKRAYKLVLSFLIALDSFQVDNLKEFARVITAPEIEMAITAQEFQESIHAYSYQYILESVVEPDEADEIYNLWREDEVLRERNQVIGELYDSFIKSQDLEDFLKAVFGNYILEGLYFYSGFAFFYILGRQGKMTNTVQQIKYIHRDEVVHVSLFSKLIRELQREGVIDEKFKRWAHSYLKWAVDSEIRWALYISEGKIPLMERERISTYLKYLANVRALAVDLPPPYEEVKNNPYEWMEEFRKINTTKTDFFQRRPQTYAKGLKWD